ncbi:hypothetical protein IAT38_004995 [Cryptococcus sp. DSM 104549]
MLALLTLLPLLACVTASPIEKRYSGVKIQSYRDGKCLTPSNKNYGNGVSVTTVGCGQAATWDINPGSGSVVLHGTGFALDAGTGRDNNEGVKIWQSYPTLFQQTWYLTDDKRIAITGGNQCLDEGDNGPQTYQCTPYNTNQVWNIVGGGGTPSSSASASASSTSSAAPSSTGIPPGKVYKDPAGGKSGRRIHPNGRNDLCVTAGWASANPGTAVNIAYCLPNKSEFSKYQLWDITWGQSSKLSLKSFPDVCLDVGANPGSGSRLYLATCGDKPQVWDYSGDKLVLHDRGLAVDVQEGSGKTSQTPYDIEENLQVWQAFAGNTNQVFTLLAS